MRILVNYSESDSNYLPLLRHTAKQLNLDLALTAKPRDIHTLLDLASKADCQGIFIANQITLTNILGNKKATLAHWRGSKLRYSIPVIIGDSLSKTVSTPAGKFLLENDLGKFLSTNVKVPAFSYTVLKTPALFAECYATLSSCDLIAYDLETKTLPSANELEAGPTLITCAGWTGVKIVDGEYAYYNYVLPFINYDGDHWLTEEEYAKAILLLQKVNALQIDKVMHNGLYDCTHSLVYRAVPSCWTLDTMGMMHSMYSELPKTLDFTASLFLPDYMQWKDDADAASKAKDIEKYWGYNAKDIFNTARICVHLLEHMPAYAKKNYKQKFRNVYPSLYCAFEGILIDQEARKEVREEETKRLDSNLATLRVMVSDKEFNPSSPKQVQFYVYDILGARDPRVGMRKDPKTKRRTRTIRGTDNKNLKAVGEQHPILNRVCEAIIDYREARKAVSTYMDFKQKNGRLLYALNPFGTETGRMSCETSNLWCGTQVQNIPKYAKKMLVRDEGYVLVEIDNSQSEARCTAYLARDYALAAALEDSEKDFYRSLGTLFFNMPYEEVTTEFRNKVLKKIVHGTNYMMGAKTFTENIGLSNLLLAAETMGLHITMAPKAMQGEVKVLDFSRRLLEAYHGPFHRVRPWYQEIKYEIMSTGFLVSPLGWTRKFFADVSKNHQAFNSAVAHAPQNLSVSILDRSFWRMWQYQKQLPRIIRIKAQIHDSIFFQIRKDKIGMLPEIVENLEMPVKVHGKTLRIPMDMELADNWGKKMSYDEYVEKENTT